jgi:SynChlorMet cassette radical SAM/SPASM protein ScmE
VSLMKTPKKMDITITSRCNLRCRYCYHFESAEDSGEDLPLEEWLRLFEELNRCAVMNLILAGGEPFIREDLKEFIDGIVRNRMRFSLLSNGTLITDEMAAYLASTKRCDSVQVSIDGAVPITHDSCRGKGSFVAAVNGVRALLRHGVSVAVRVTIHRKNVHDLEGVARLLLEDLRLPGFSTNSASHLGLCRKNAEQIQLTIEERMLAMDILLKLTKKYNGRISATAGPLSEARGWLKMETARQEGIATMPGKGFLTGCNGTRDKLAVRPDGVITPCTMLSHIELGRVNEDGLRDSWQNHTELKALRERHLIPLGCFSFCQGCEYIPYCTGSCPGLAYTMTGNVHHPAPDACLRNFLRDGGKLLDRSLLEDQARREAVC